MLDNKNFCLPLHKIQTSGGKPRTFKNCNTLSRSNPIWSFLSHNKYWIVIIIGVLITVVVDENSVMQRLKLDMQISDLKEQIADYNAQYERDQARLKDLRRNPHAITKIARERYFMKADDEDIFVLSDELPTATENETAK